MSLGCDTSLSPAPTSSDEERRERLLYERLETCSVVYRRFEHPRVFTVKESRKLASTVPGLDIRNLFVRDRKRRFFLLCLSAETPLDLKALGKGESGERLGIVGRLSFASPQDLMRLLKVEPGAVNPFSVMFDEERAVSLVLDRAIATSRRFNAHPMRNDRSIALSGEDFLRFLAYDEREALLFDFARKTE